MSNLAAGPITKGRTRSRLSNSIVGFATPETIVPFTPSAAPGAVGTWVFPAPRACKLVRISYVADVNGAGASKVFVRKHVAGQTAAASAATSGSNIVDVVSGGIAADSTVRAPVQVTTLQNNTLAAGDKLAVVTPATWLGSLLLYVVWL